jgi:hypothetical protein
MAMTVGTIADRQRKGYLRLLEEAEAKWRGPPARGNKKEGKI